VLAIGIGLLRPREPVYQGKPLTFWLPQMSVNSPQAQLAFQDVGTKALPFLERKIRSEFAIWRQGYRAAWSKFPTVVQMCLWPPGDLNNSWAAVFNALKAIGPSTLPTMTDWLHRRDAHVRFMAVLVFKETDPAAWPDREKTIQILTQYLPDDAVCGGTKYCAAWALARVRK
jgi:hypothetical protein